MEREEAINFLKGYLDEEVYTEKCRNAHEMAIKALEQEPILDKIRAEIANRCGVNTDYCDSCRFCTDSMEVREILQIIDKYKGEVRGKE